MRQANELLKVCLLSVRRCAGENGVNDGSFSEIAVYGEFATVGTDHFVYDGEPEARAAGVAVSGGIHSVEPLG